MFRYQSEIQPENAGEGILVKHLGAGQNMNVLHWDLAAGAVVPIHTHEQEQFGYVIKGGFDMTIGDERAVLKAADCYFIPSGAPHGFITLEETEAIDVFSPVRVGIFQPKQ